MKKSDKAAVKEVRKKIVDSLKIATKRMEAIGKETKAQLEILALSVKKEQLYRQIGKKVWQLASQGNLSTKKLQSLCKELSEINKKAKTRGRSTGR